jgi:hypothetical protein
MAGILSSINQIYSSSSKNYKMKKRETEKIPPPSATQGNEEFAS